LLAPGPAAVLWPRVVAAVVVGRSRQLTDWVATELVQEEDHARRVLLLRHFIRLAQVWASSSRVGGRAVDTRAVLGGDNRSWSSCPTMMAH
jgi:hypothetical protein